MFRLGEGQIEQLCYAVLTIFVIVVFIILLKKFGNLKGQHFGIELNLLTYGFLAETSISALRGNSYWPNYDVNLVLSKGAILFSLSLINLILMAWNFKLAERSFSDKDKRKILWNKFVVGFLGCISLSIFLALNIYWD